LKTPAYDKATKENTSMQTTSKIKDFFSIKSPRMLIFIY